MVIARLREIVIAWLLLFSGGCYLNLGPGTPKAFVAPDEATRAAMIGTWQFESAAGEPGRLVVVPTPFFVRFYADGFGASWPLGHEDLDRVGFNDSDAVSWGRYDQADGRLFFIPNGNVMTFEMMNDKLITTDRDGTRIIYHRVKPDLIPNHLPGQDGE